MTQKGRFNFGSLIFISNSGTIHERGRGAIMSIAVIVTTEKMFMVVYCRTLLRYNIKQNNNKRNHDVYSSTIYHISYYIFND